jgi:predicted amidohydrolase
MTSATAIRHDGKLTVALVSEAFFEADGVARLQDRLQEAAEGGADVALLPEIPLNRWSPATKVPADDDAEDEGGPRTQAMASAARAARIGLVGGIIRRDPGTGRRTSRALVFDAGGAIVGRYEKLHLPEEPGFWETSHYEPGTEPPHRIDTLGVPVGVQICSDTNRPEGSHLLGADGAIAILIPRATEERTYQKWKLVFRANAITSCAYVISVNRPSPEHGVLIGGPSIGVTPAGEVLVETTDRLSLVTIDEAVVRRARSDYPGYLPVRARLYADAWAEIAGRGG